MLTTFLYSLAGGMLAVVATGRMEQIAWRFLRLVGSVAFAATCILTIWAILRGEAAGGWVMRLGVVSATAAAAVIFLAPLAGRLPRVFRLVCGLGGLAGLSAGCVSVLALLPEPAETVLVTALLVAGQVLSGMLLGSITVAWLLGHAYLTATRMTIAPLDYFTRTLLWAVAARAAFFLVSVVVGWAFSGDAGVSILARMVESWLVVVLRVGAGLVAVGVFGYMVRDCVRLRATQSATGILFFGSLFAYVGELANQYLIAAWGRPM